MDCNFLITGRWVYFRCVSSHAVLLFCLSFSQLQRRKTDQRKVFYWVVKCSKAATNCRLTMGVNKFVLTSFLCSTEHCIFLTPSLLFELNQLAQIKRLVVNLVFLVETGSSSHQLSSPLPFRSRFDEFDHFVFPISLRVHGWFGYHIVMTV